jgi:hypothetical protein
MSTRSEFLADPRDLSRSKKGLQLWHGRLDCVRPKVETDAPRIFRLRRNTAGGRPCHRCTSGNFRRVAQSRAAIASRLRRGSTAGFPSDLQHAAVGKLSERLYRATCMSYATRRALSLLGCFAIVVSSLDIAVHFCIWRTKQGYFFLLWHARWVFLSVGGTKVWVGLAMLLIFVGVALGCWIALWVAAINRDGRRSFGLCVNCGYDLRASRVGRCPECGEWVNHAPSRLGAVSRRTVIITWATFCIIVLSGWVAGSYDWPALRIKLHWYR